MTYRACWAYCADEATHVVVDTGAACSCYWVPPGCAASMASAADFVPQEKIYITYDTDCANPVWLYVAFAWVVCIPLLYLFTLK